MKQVSRKYKQILASASLLILPAIVHAQQIKNPLSATSIQGLLVSFTRFLLGLVGSLALLALVVGGIKYITSFGNENGIASAKKIIFWAIAGLIVVFMSYLVITVVQGLLGA